MSDSEASREDRQLEASERRVQQAREQGQIPRSRELVHLAAAISLLVLLLGLGPWLAQQSLELVGTGLRFDRATAFEPARLGARLSWFGLHGLMVIVPVAGAMALLLTAASIAIGGWNFTLQALRRFDRPQPRVAGFGRMLDWRAHLQHLRLVLVAGALVGCGGIYLAQHAYEIAALARVPLASGLRMGLDWLVNGLGLVVGVCMVSALADVPMQIFKHKADLRMTQDEARQEHKESEGDPHMKGERRRRARELVRGRMLADVPKANVVVTNPTHYAVALQYDEGMAAPRIVAMGTDHLALKIREVAAANRVPVLEAPPLARALYRHGDVGAQVPVELYTAVDSGGAGVGLSPAHRAHAAG